MFETTLPTLATSAARARRVVRLPELSPTALAMVFALLTVLFTVLTTQLLLAGTGNPLDHLGASFSPRDQADYHATPNRQIRPLRVPASARGD